VGRNAYQQRVEPFLAISSHHIKCMYICISCWS
jgi:hypothetical protein